MSQVLPRLPEPVLSPTAQSAGTPARRRLSPVWLPSQPGPDLRARGRHERVAQEDLLHGWPAWRPAWWCRAGRRARDFIEAGLVAVEPRLGVAQTMRRKRVRPAGPPKLASIRFAAGVVAQRDGRLAQFGHGQCRGVAEHASRSPVRAESGRAVPIGDAPLQPLLRPGPRGSAPAAAARNLKVLHIGKRSSARWPARRPLPVSRMDTPAGRRLAFSMSAICRCSSGLALGPRQGRRAGQRRREGRPKNVGDPS